MELRVLEQQEHRYTRALWKSIFEEDTETFLDYYYKVKTQCNTIYVVEDQDEIRAMLQLNPYKLRVEDKQVKTHYIIGVATEAAYRRKGLMGELLRKAMCDMYKHKEPFTFLMPAAEAIYLPYDFRFIYAQKQATVRGRRSDIKIDVREAMAADTGKMVSLSRKIMPDRYQVYAIRNKTYYETMIQEQLSEAGGVALVHLKKKLIGMFAYSNEAGAEIREPLFLPGYEHYLEYAVYELIGDEKTEVPCFACQCPDVDLQQEEKLQTRKPVIMARILCVESLLRTIKTKDNQSMRCSFAIIDPIIIGNNRILIMEYNPSKQQMEVRETEDSDGVFTIAAFTSFIFGYRTLDSIAQEEGVILTEQLKHELGKVQVLEHIFLNEIV